MGHIQDRFALFVENTKLPKYEISKMIGVSPSLVGKIAKGENSFSVDILEKILEVFPELNPIWLLRGEGEMYASKEQKTIPVSELEYIKETIANLQNKINHLVA